MVKGVIMNEEVNKDRFKMFAMDDFEKVQVFPAALPSVHGGTV